MQKFKEPHFGIGIGLRRENSEDLARDLPKDIDCLEVAPENYFHTGGKLFREFSELAKHYPIVFHGISLSIGSLKPLNWDYIKEVKKFVGQFNGKWMSDHICYSSVLGAQFHGLLPLPFTQEAIDHVVPRIRQVQDFLEMPLAMENVSCYVHPGESEMSEWNFISEIVDGADCSLLLDVNNVYVNSVNFSFDPYEYLANIPYERVQHIHIAGHKQMDGYLLDNHGARVIDPVWDLLEQVAEKTDLPAVIIERDNNVPPLDALREEARHARRVVEKGLERRKLTGAVS